MPLGIACDQTYFLLIPLVLPILGQGKGCMALLRVGLIEFFVLSCVWTRLDAVFCLALPKF